MSPSPGSSTQVLANRGQYTHALQEWLAARDKLYEDIMTKAWNPKERFFGQSYEDRDVVDSAVVIMPLVFFSAAVRLLFSHENFETGP